MKARHILKVELDSELPCVQWAKCQVLNANC